MFKKEKILLSLIALSLLGLVLVVVISNYQRQSRISADQSSLSSDKQAQIAILEDSYRQNIKQAMKDYSALAQDPAVTAEQLGKVKQAFMDIRVPTKYKDLHLNIILSLDKLTAALEKGSTDDKLANMQALDEIKRNNTWMN